MVGKVSEGRMMNALELLTRYELTSTQLAARLGVTPQGGRYHIAALRKAGQVRVVRWIKNGKQTAPVYAAGTGKDAPKPKPETKAQTMKRYNEKHRAKVRLGQRKTAVTPWDVLGVTGVTWGMK
jgi:transcription initiation factor IIE alpha subunit